MWLKEKQKKKEKHFWVFSVQNSVADETSDVCTWANGMTEKERILHIKLKMFALLFPEHQDF